MYKNRSFINYFFLYGSLWCFVSVLIHFIFSWPPLLSVPSGVLVAGINLLWFFWLMKISSANPTSSSAVAAFMLSILKLPFLFTVAWIVAQSKSEFIEGFFAGYLFFIAPALHWAVLESRKKVDN